MDDTSTVAERFGDNLVVQRRRAGLSQEQLAQRASLHRTEIGLLERGFRLARIDTVVKLAGALEMEAGFFFDGLSWTAGSNIDGGFSVARPEVRQRRGRVGL
jgi:transcriptional regulator with XRE-family HTH domain